MKAETPHLKRMKKWYGGAIVASLFMLLLLRYGFMKNPVEESYLMNSFSSNGTNPLEWVRFTAPHALQNPGNASQVISLDIIALSLFAQRNLSKGEQQSLITWNLLKHLINHSHALPNGVEAIKEAGSAWNSLMASVEEEKLGYANDNSSRKAKEKQCPQFLSKMNATEPESRYKLRVPCGLTQGSSITIIGIPNGVLGDFRIDLRHILLLVLHITSICLAQWQTRTPYSSKVPGLIPTKGSSLVFIFPTPIRVSPNKVVTCVTILLNN
ncbi:hypothetical protein HRI_000774300 [Hibiscus trionum]|uniref:Uncharacterized protein n=1 Tax=Hibiscus trionum TaxID=183268 RepID=A0A9W7H818_HIBTR|nr:hypothetical protein HRI_000774300 [Hibiscus trionum]